MEQSARILVGWKYRVVEGYCLSFAVLAALFDSLPLALTGSASTPASAFLSLLKARMLPQVLLELCVPAAG